MKDPFQQYHDLDTKGWILAPKETFEHLLQRKNRANEHARVITDAAKAHRHTKMLFHFQLEQIPIVENNKSLAPWQGAVLWSYEETNLPPYPVIQLSTKWKHRKTEMLSHELVHAARFHFHEPIFEEVLAYQTSLNRYTRFFGPVFLSPKEPLCCLIFLLLGLFGTWFYPLCVFFSPILLAVLLFRLCIIQSIFIRARRNLQKANSPAPLAILLRLSDREIFRCAFTHPSTIKQQFLNSKELRLQYVASRFFT